MGVTSLRKLIIEADNIDVPDSLGKLDNLEFIEITGYGIKRLPDCICNLKNLKIMYLKGINQVLDLGGLDSLNELYIERCNIKSMPKEFGNLYNLIRCIIVECKLLEYLPNDIDGLTSLEELELKYCNSLKELPEELCKNQL